MLPLASLERFGEEDLVLKKLEIVQTLLEKRMAFRNIFRNLGL